MPGSKAHAAGESVSEKHDPEAERRLLDAIEEGLADADAGRVHAHAQAIGLDRSGDR